MDIQDYWEKALKQTEIIRPRVQALSTYGATHLPYIFLAESAANSNTVIKKGEVLVEKPGIILPNNLPNFEGFESEENFAWNDQMLNFLLIRGVRFPSFKYNNKTHALDLFEGKLQAAIRHYRDQLERGENVSTGLIVGPEDCWHFSVLIFTASQMARQSEGDFKKLWDDFRREKGSP